METRGGRDAKRYRPLHAGTRPDGLGAARSIQARVVPVCGAAPLAEAGGRPVRGAEGASVREEPAGARSGRLGVPSEAEWKQPRECSTVSPPTSPPLSRGQPRLDPTRPLRILVVDDAAVIRELCAELIRGLGYQVEVVADAEEALTRLRNEPFDAVVTDIVMPGMDGWHLIAAAIHEHPTMRLVAITGATIVEGD